MGDSFQAKIFIQMGGDASAKSAARVMRDFDGGWNGLPSYGVSVGGSKITLNFGEFWNFDYGDMKRSFPLLLDHITTTEGIDLRAYDIELEFWSFDPYQPLRYWFGKDSTYNNFARGLALAASEFPKDISPDLVSELKSRHPDLYSRIDAFVQAFRGA